MGGTTNRQGSPLVDGAALTCAAVPVSSSIPKAGPRPCQVATSTGSFAGSAPGRLRGRGGHTAGGTANPTNEHRPILASFRRGIRIQRDSWHSRGVASPVILVIRHSHQVSLLPSTVLAAG